jgi:hypothetical protein
MGRSPPYGILWAQHALLPPRNPLISLILAKILISELKTHGVSITKMALNVSSSRHFSRETGWMNAAGIFVKKIVDNL